MPTHQLKHALYQSVSSRPIAEQWGNLGSDEPDPTGAAADRPTNIYFLLHYRYQVSLSAVPMADHELGLLLPRSGHVWLNARLFSDVPRGRELATRDVWWRAIDISPAVRFLLGWCVSLYRTAHLQGVAHERLPGWSRRFYFSPQMQDTSKERVQLWSDIVCNLTELFAPESRIWRQLQAIAPIRAGDRHWRLQLAHAHQNLEDMLRILESQNNCPATLIQRTLDGNQPITSLDDYVDFTESILHDIPLLQMQRLMAIRAVAGQPRPQASPAWGAGMPDPRRRAAFWQLHL